MQQVYIYLRKILRSHALNLTLETCFAGVMFVTAVTRHKLSSPEYAAHPSIAIAKPGAQLEPHQASPQPCPAPQHLSLAPLWLWEACAFDRGTSPIPFPRLASEKQWKWQPTISKRVHAACGLRVVEFEEAPGSIDA